MAKKTTKKPAKKIVKKTTTKKTVKRTSAKKVPQTKTIQINYPKNKVPEWIKWTLIILGIVYVIQPYLNNVNYRLELLPLLVLIYAIKLFAYD